MANKQIIKKNLELLIKKVATEQKRDLSTIESIAEYTQIPYETIYGLLKRPKSKTCNPGIDTVLKLCERLSCEPNDILKNTFEAKKSPGGCFAAMVSEEWGYRLTLLDQNGEIIKCLWIDVPHNAQDPQEIFYPVNKEIENAKFHTNDTVFYLSIANSADMCISTLQEVGNYFYQKAIITDTNVHAYNALANPAHNDLIINCSEYISYCLKDSLQHELSQNQIIPDTVYDDGGLIWLGHQVISELSLRLMVNKKLGKFYSYIEDIFSFDLNQINNVITNLDLDMYISVAKKCMSYPKNSDFDALTKKGCEYIYQEVNSKFEDVGSVYLIGNLANYYSNNLKKMGLNIIHYSAEEYYNKNTQYLKNLFLTTCTQPSI